MYLYVPGAEVTKVMVTLDPGETPRIGFGISPPEKTTVEVGVPFTGTSIQECGKAELDDTSSTMVTLVPFATVMVGPGEVPLNDSVLFVPAISVKVA